jgi:hypothetical protein
MLEVSGERLQTTERFPLKLNRARTRWSVSRSVPSGMTIDEAMAPGTTVTIIIRNPDGTVLVPSMRAK